MFQFGEISIGRIFTYLNAAFGLSIIISFVLIQFIDPSVLTLFQLNIKGYNTDGSNETSGALIFPFSVSYGLLVEYNITRFLGIGRESGIGQMFLCWSFVYAYLNKMSKYVIWTCFFGGALCMATSGIVSLGVSFFILMNVRNNDAYSLLKKYVSFLIPFVMAFVLIFAPGIGLNNKQETHSASITDRTDAIFDAFNNEHIVFGTGLYSDHKYDNAAINLLAGVSEYGIVGLFLLLAIFVIPLFYKSINKMYYLALVAPLVITSMFFQPLFDAPLFYVVCILSTSCAYINPISSNKYT